MYKIGSFEVINLYYNEKSPHSNFVCVGLLVFFVGYTGFEPVTSTMSR